PIVEPDGNVDLQQPSKAAFIAVFGVREVRDIGELAAIQRGTNVVFDREPAPNDVPVVRVDDDAFGIPYLHDLDAVVENVSPHQTIKSGVAPTNEIALEVGLGKFAVQNLEIVQSRSFGGRQRRLLGDSSDGPNQPKADQYEHDQGRE